jgi:zinc protease
MIYGYFTNLNYDEASYNSYKAKQQGFLDNLLANPQTYFQSEVQKYLNQKILDSSEFCQMLKLGKKPAIN